MVDRQKALEARVRCVNKVNAHANELYPKLVELFQPLVGCKINKVDGSFLKKIQEEVRALVKNDEFHVYRYNSRYSLVFTVKSDEVVDGHAYYHEISVYVGKMSYEDPAVLEKLEPWTTLKTDYSVDTVMVLRKAHKEAKQKVSDAESALHPFGEYDR